MENNSCTPINPKQYSCYGLKIIHTSIVSRGDYDNKEFDKEKNSCGSKIPHSPHNFFNGPFLKGGARFGNPTARSVGTFESNYKMAATEGERSISTILRQKGDCEHPVNVIIECN